MHDSPWPQWWRRMFLLILQFADELTYTSVRVCGCVFKLGSVKYFCCFCSTVHKHLEDHQWSRCSLCSYLHSENWSGEYFSIMKVNGITWGKSGWHPLYIYISLYSDTRFESPELEHFSLSKKYLRFLSLAHWLLQLDQNEALLHWPQVNRASYQAAEHSELTLTQHTSLSIPFTMHFNSTTTTILTN